MRRQPTPCGRPGPRGPPQPPGPWHRWSPGWPPPARPRRSPRRRPRPGRARSDDRAIASAGVRGSPSRAATIGGGTGETTNRRRGMPHGRLGQHPPSRSAGPADTSELELSQGQLVAALETVLLRVRRHPNGGSWQRGSNDRGTCAQPAGVVRLACQTALRARRAVRLRFVRAFTSGRAPPDRRHDPSSEIAPRPNHPRREPER